MANPVDKRGILDQGIFEYRAAKDGKVFLLWCGRQVKTLSGGEAARFLARVRDAEEKEAQLLMAKATGNFKRGNERAGKPRA